VGNHPEDSLAKFGCKQDVKVKKRMKHPSHFCLHARTLVIVNYMYRNSLKKNVEIW
jgi:hypothetical protein